MCKLNNRISKILDNYDDFFVTKITLCKKELSDHSNTILNYLSCGDYLNKKKKYDFKVHHANILVELNNKIIIFIDKRGYIYINEIHEKDLLEYGLMNTIEINNCR